MGYCDKEKNRNKWICKSVVNPVKKAASNVVKKAQSVLKDAGDNIKYAPLLPFKPMMVAVLKKKGEGVNIQTPLKTLAPLFYQRVVQKKTKINYEELESLDFLYYEDLDPATMGLVKEGVNREGAKAELGIQTIVNLILSFIKGKQEDKEAGAPQTEEDANIVKLSNDAASEVVTTESQVTLTSSTANWFKQNKVLVIGVLAVVVFLVLKKK